MLDRKFIIENVEAVRENCRLRGTSVELDRFLELDQQRRKATVDVEELKRQQNEVTAQIKQAKSQEERQPLVDQSKQTKERIKHQETAEAEILAAMEEIQKSIPNMTHPDAPVGADDLANKELSRGKTPIPTFDFTPLDHLTLGERLGIIDMESGAKVAGSGFYFLKGDAVLLELALQRYALDLLMEQGFQPVITPDLARNEILGGTGYMPRGPETQIYSIENTDLSLIATAEITLGGLMYDTLLEEEQLPIKLCGLSHCFRTEAGSHGRASRGLYRVHQFTKVEMFAFTTPEDSAAMLDHLLKIECQLFDGLEVPYRVVDTATGDLGGPAYRKFDLEAWMPGRGEAGEFGEVTSTSNCTDYQARRLKARFRKSGEKGSTFIHTLNGTAIAISRGLIAVLENHQQADGSVIVPEVLKTWMGKDRIGPPTAP